MTRTTTPARRSLWQRLFSATPASGPMTRKDGSNQAAGFWYALAAGLGVWGCAVYLFGLPGLYLPALAMVPVIFALFLVITKG